MFNRFLIIISLFVLLTACGQTVPPSTIIDAKAGGLDHLISFNSDGYAALRGRISGGSQCPGEDGMPVNVFMEVEMPVIVQGIETYIAVPFRVEMQTEITSSLTPAANAQDFFTANPQASFTEAFAIYQSVEISFTKNDGGFLASAVREIIPQDPSQAVNLAGIFTVNAFSQGTLEGGGSFQQNWSHDGSRMTWIIALDYTLHGVPVNIELPLEVTQSTQSVFKDGRTVLAVPEKNDNDLMPVLIAPHGNFRIEFTLKDNLLEVSRIVEWE